MPLEHAAVGTKGFGRNVATEVRAGKPEDQAVAIAYSQARGDALGDYPIMSAGDIMEQAQRAGAVMDAAREFASRADSLRKDADISERKGEFFFCQGGMKEEHGPFASRSDAEDKAREIGAIRSDALGDNRVTVNGNGDATVWWKGSQTKTFPAKRHHDPKALAEEYLAKLERDGGVPRKDASPSEELRKQIKEGSWRSDASSSEHFKAGFAFYKEHRRHPRSDEIPFGKTPRDQFLRGFEKAYSTLPRVDSVR